MAQTSLVLIFSRTTRQVQHFLSSLLLSLSPSLLSTCLLTHYRLLRRETGENLTHAFKHKWCRDDQTLEQLLNSNYRSAPAFDVTACFRLQPSPHDGCSRNLIE